ncbi:MAG TPA: recombinase family protein [Edaphobacter sp.]|uniref:recombinase family protein n=1 Tax=Edaphobacter sp. TaxID=1934404 RepID=UPI002CE99891|nr:recombinase family protein [Edaphobacter sp.]HUZ96974.1 recombinase family protein [Edaphobacter sp.]
MRADAHQKVNADHLQRNAYLYVRQSTLRQVFENTESTMRQYDLRQHALALGWAPEQIVVIDNDLGQSGASAVGREGFQHLVTEVSMGHAGIVLGLEVSRLARNSTDWHRLLEICALTDTLILDEDGVYDPAHYNDRLLLGLKGTLSEAELHVIKARLQGGILNKARRGELESALPVGLTYNPAHQPVLDPDKHVQESLRFFFDTFDRTGSAMATMKTFHQRGLLFPRRLRKGPQKGDLVWTELTHSRALQVLHNPRYAGAFVYGRKRVRKKADGSETCLKRPRDQWILLPDMHPGYISWEQYEENQRRLSENAQAQGDDRRKSPPREGPALLQGLVLCGVCGRRMTVRYHSRGTRPVPDYLCQRDGIEHGKPICQSINGEQIDKAIGELLIQTMTPMTLDIALAVQQELRTRLDEVDRLRRKQVERARYEADQAQLRYMHVDPANRLVADTLEAEWNGKLRALNEAQQEYERLRQTDHLAIDEAQRTRIAALASDFPRLWQDPNTPDRERKRMVRLLLEDVTLLKREQIQVHVRFKGGVLKSLSLQPPLSAPYLRKTPAVIVREVDRLLDQHTNREVAAILNEKGLRSGSGRPFTVMAIINIRRHHGLRDCCQRMRDLGLLTIQQIAERLDIGASAVKDWRDRGLLRGHRYNDKGQCLYELPADDLPGKYKRKSAYLVANGNVRASAKGVQYEA